MKFWFKQVLQFQLQLWISLNSCQKSDPVSEVSVYQNFLHCVGSSDLFNCCEEIFRFYRFGYSPLLGITKTLSASLQLSTLSSTSLNWSKCYPLCTRLLLISMLLIWCCRFQKSSWFGKLPPRVHRLCSVHSGLIKWSGLPCSLTTGEDLEPLRQCFPFAHAWGQAGPEEEGGVSSNAQIITDRLAGPRTRLRLSKPNPRYSSPEWKLPMWTCVRRVCRRLCKERW